MVQKYKDRLLKREAKLEELAKYPDPKKVESIAALEIQVKAREKENMALKVKLSDLKLMSLKEAAKALERDNSLTK